MQARRVASSLDKLGKGPLEIFRAFQLPVGDAKAKEEVNIVLFVRGNRFERFDGLLVLVKYKVRHPFQVAGRDAGRVSGHVARKVRDGVAEILILIVAKATTKREERICLLPAVDSIVACLGVLSLLI